MCKQCSTHFLKVSLSYCSKYFLKILDLVLEIADVFKLPITYGQIDPRMVPLHSSLAMSSGDTWFKTDTACNTSLMSSASSSMISDCPV